MTAGGKSPPSSHGAGRPDGADIARVVPGPGRIRRRDVVASRLHAEVDSMLASLEAAADCAEAARALREEGLKPAERLARFAGVLESLAADLIGECARAFRQACAEQRFAPEELADLDAALKGRILGYFRMLLRAHGGNLLEGLSPDEAAGLLAEAEDGLAARLGGQIADE